MGNDGVARLRAGALELTARELDVLRCAAAGLDRQGTARELFLADNTVAFHRTAIYRKLGAVSMAHAIAIAYDREWFVPRTPDVLIFGDTRYVRADP